MARPELKWWQVRWGFFGRGAKRIGLWLAIALAAGWTLMAAGRYIYGFFAPWYLIQDEGKEPSAWVVPTPLSDQSVAQLTGTRVEAYGYSIQTPWSDQPEIRRFKSITLATFHETKAGMMLYDPAEETTEDYPVKYGSDPDIRKLYSDQDRSSFYQLTADEFAAVPSQARWWTRRENVRLFMLLMDKQIEILDFRSVHNIDAGALRGFQLGDPAKPPYRVLIKLFDPHDRRTQLEISTSPDGYSVLTQSQLNAMLASIRPAAQKPQK